ncbi:hypothetical protein C8J57DRAFT_1279735 [Mycena rebaudengoi]|nr:hypothetical protein C8J57DRAFT_1279735 [Mycena rebaudengoi]
MSQSTPLLSVGKQCSAQSCMLVDFLPFQCQHCESSFCQEHFMVTAHKCPKYDEAKYNRVAPNCPLCNEPVSVRPGQDANVAMEGHFTRDCSVMTGKVKPKSTPICGKARCGKALFAPIRCPSCNVQFCPSHRFPADHDCSPTSTNARTRTTGPTAASRLLDLNTKASAAGTATLGAIKNMTSAATSAAQASSSRAPAPKSSSAPTTTTANINLFSKTDRRAKAERESRRKAMQERAKKGLLSAEEKLILASEEAERSHHSDPSKKDCVIM